MRYLLLCLFLLSSRVIADESLEDFLSSSPEEIMALTEPEDFLVGRIVHPLSGQIVLRQTDLIARGAENISLHRTLVSEHKALNEKNGKIHPSKQKYAGWVTFPHTHLSIFESGKEKSNKMIPNERLVCVPDPHGAVLVYEMKDSNTLLKSNDAGISNGLTSPSGKNDPRNTSIEIKGLGIVVRVPDGTERHYAVNRLSTLTYEKKVYSAKHALLNKEVLPNGKILRYHYNENRQVIKVESQDPLERFTYATLTVDSSLFTNKATFSTETGNCATYTHDTGMFFKEKYQQKCCDLLYPLHLQKVNSPFFEKEQMQYDHHRLCLYISQFLDFACTYTPYDKKKPSFVNQLSFLNETGQFRPLYTLEYIPSSAKIGPRTVVSNVDGTKIVYQFTTKKLLKTIEYFDQKNALVKSKVFTWTKNQWLESVSIRNEKQYLLSQRVFKYDSFGNPISETFKGDLTGDGKTTSDTIYRSFSKDGRHLLETESFSNGKTISYTYLPHTNLITSKLTKQKDGNCLLRKFYEYDDCNNLISVIEDDGTEDAKDSLINVTERKIIRYTLRIEPPFLHMPEWMHEKYLEDGQEKLLKSTHFVYDKEGRIAEEQTYDENGEFSYTTQKSYTQGDCLESETNALGQKALYTYDHHGREKTAASFSQNKTKCTDYDQKGRVQSVQEVGIEGTCHKYTYQYDLNDHLIQKIDPYQLSTTYTYNPVINAPVETFLPFILNTEMKPIPVVTTASYDSLGRKTRFTDSNDQTTTYKYNAYGSATEICYPDESCEIFRYTAQGLLEKETDREGLTTHYTYDPLGNITCKNYSKDNELLAKETFTYKGTRLTQTSDKEGYITSYSYDKAGRKIQEERCGCIKTFQYDSRGQLSIICAVNGENSIYTHFKRDLLGQVLEETKTGSDNIPLTSISYTYDGEGNVRTIQKEVNDIPSTERFKYDAFNRLVRYEDPYREVTQTFYDENSYNTIGQRVLKTTKIHPDQTSIVETHDSYERVVFSETLNAKNDTIAASSSVYDPCGLLIQHQDHVYKEDQFQTTKTTCYSYDSVNRIKNYTRAYGTNDARTSQFSHTPNGHLKSKTLPDGTILNYTYDSFGYLKTLSSSNLNLSFSYNRLGYLEKAIDASGFSIQRTVDPHGNVTQEVFSNGIVIDKTYDLFHRLTTLSLPDEGSILYTYDPLFLKTVSKVGPGNTFYTHQYNTYDLSGHLTSENLIANLGSVFYTTNLKHRLDSITSLYFNQQCSFDKDGLLSYQITNNTKEEFHYDDLSQLIKEQDNIYAYDSIYNRVQRNQEEYHHNTLNELTAHPYDLNGNLSSDGITTFFYDPLNRLVEAISDDKKICFYYDPLNRKVKKELYQYSRAEWKQIDEERFLYDGNNDIGTFTSEGKIKHLCVLGKRDRPTPIAIELEGKPYAPIIDCQGNVYGLLDLDKTSFAVMYDFTAFGEKRLEERALYNPWQYASKRFDPHLNLIDFGKRHYHPSQGRWLTLDPAGFANSYNLYQYNFNNPFLYTDPDGQFAIVLPLFVWAFEAGITFITLETVAATTLSALIYWAGNEFVDHLNREIKDNRRMSNIESFYSMEKRKSKGKDKKEERSQGKKQPPRTEPIDLEEQLTLEEAKGGAGISIGEGKIKDPKYSENEWKKKSWDHEHPDNTNTRTEVHYWENRQTGERHGFKFKDQGYSRYEYYQNNR